MGDLAQRLARRTLELVDIPSVSGDEAAIARRVAGSLDGRLERAHITEEVLFFRTPRRPKRPLVVLAGHLDTVPAQDNLPGRIEDGWVVGLGASDMKSGLAVMLELATWAGERGQELELDVGLLFFTREELSAAESPLPAFLESGALADAELVVMMEPTDNTIQAGCLGNLNARLTFVGTSAHSARPWLGDNAIHRAALGLRRIAEAEPFDVDVEGLRFREVVSAVAIEGGIAPNVVPDRATAELNFRYAPSRTRAEAERRLRELAGNEGTLELLGDSPPARVVVDSPLLRRLRAAGDLPLEPKQAWTPVAEFTSRGLDAVNLGPGATRYAHRRDERVEIEALVRTCTTLARFLAPGSV